MDQIEDKYDSTVGLDPWDVIGLEVVPLSFSLSGGLPLLWRVTRETENGKLTLVKQVHPGVRQD